MSDAFENYYSLAISAEECESILSGTHKTKLRSAKQKEILACLLEKGGDVAADELEKTPGDCGAQLKALVEKGLIALDQRRIWRQSFESLEEDKAEILLNEEQTEAFETVKSHLDRGKASAILLHGVTGSGKTKREAEQVAAKQASRMATARNIPGCFSYFLMAEPSHG